MQYVWDRLHRIKNVLYGQRLFLFLDYDGTLSPIANTPDNAVLPQITKNILKHLVGKTDHRIAIISGRKLSDIKTKIGLRNIIYAGNHGLEIVGAKIRFKSPVTQKLKQIMRIITQDLRSKLLGVKGALVEGKGLTLSIHYRLVSKKNLSIFEKIISEVTDPLVAYNKIRINPGKKVYEIKPAVNWDKGKVVLWIMARQQSVLGKGKFLPVYIGDDITDEDAFKALKKKGLTIFVGNPRRSAADYYLKSPGEVKKFLNLILSLDKNKLC